MRCRRVLSYLSAYCRGELTGRRRRAVRDHLDTCPECRREEAVFGEINKAMNRLPEFEVSPEFNSKLLDRVAQERFRETRTKAYLPKNIPIFGYGKLIPAFASVCLVLTFVFLGGLDILNRTDKPNVYADREQSAVELNDAYLTAEPLPERAYKEHTKANWVFKKKLAKANRMRNLMNRLASQNSFGTPYSYSTNYQVIPASQSLIMRQPLGVQTADQTQLISGN